MSRLAAHDIEKIEEILCRASGLVFTKSLRKSLYVALEKAAAASALDEKVFLKKLLDGEPDCINKMVEHSVIGETYFFRHPEQFVALKHQIMQDFLSEKNLRVWSAGCSTGEETYSAAMTLLDAGRQGAMDKVLGTDICQRVLSIASEGVYGSWSMRKLDPILRQRHFVPLDEHQMRVSPEAMKRVEFKKHNLVADPIPIKDCHLIFCRNVLIYFMPETMSMVLHKLASALLPGGILILSPIEIPQASLLSLEWLEVDGATLLRKPLSVNKAKVIRISHHAIAATHSLSHKTVKQARQQKQQHILPTPVPEPVVKRMSLFEQAREAARQGRIEEAERLASQSASDEMLPESFLLLSMAAESRGDLQRAVEQVRKALYLEPRLATGHALLVALFTRLNRTREAEHARRNAIQALEGIEESAILKGVEAITAKALRIALQARNDSRWQEND